MPSRWIEFIREYALKNNTTYGCALSRPEVVTEYHKKYNTAKYQKMRQKGIMSESLEEALPSEAQAKAPINLQVKKTGKVKVVKFTIDGTEYYRSRATNYIYDIKTKEELGIWNPDKKIIEPLPDDSDDESEEESPPPKIKKNIDFTRSINISYGGEPSWQMVKTDMFDNSWLFSVLDEYFGFVTPKGKVYRFKDGEFPSKKQEKYYEDILAKSITQNLIGDKNNYLKLL